MADKTPIWALFVSLVSLFLFSFWAISDYLSNPAEIPMEPLVMAIISLLGFIGSLFFRMNTETRRKNINTKTIKAKGGVTIGDDGSSTSGNVTDKNINDGTIHSGSDVRIGDTQTGGQ